MPVSNENKAKLEAARASRNNAPVTPSVQVTPTVYGQYRGGDSLPVRIGSPAQPREQTERLIEVKPFAGGEETFTDVGGQISFEGDMQAAYIVLNAMKAISRRRINVIPQPNNRPGGEETRMRFQVSFHVDA